MASPNTLVVMPLAEQRGGAELALMHLLAQSSLPSRTKWAIAFLEEGPMVEQAHRLGAAVRVIRSGRLRQVNSYIDCVHSIARWAVEINASTIIGWMSKAQLYGGPAGMLARKPAVWFQHGIPGGAIDWIASAIPAKGVLCCSEQVAAMQRRSFPRHDIRVVYPGVELERFDSDSLPSPAQARQELAIPADGPLVGIVARLQRWKGVHVVLEAMEHLWESFPNARCVVVGGEHSLERAYATKITEFASKVSRPDRLHLVGQQSDAPIWMQAMDVVVHASRKEPFGMVVIEAMSLGKPVVASIPGGPAEVITNGVDGLLVNFGDARQLGQAIGFFLNDPNLMERCGRAAKIRAADFSAIHFSGNVSDAVSSLLAVSNPHREQTVD
tara:strand:- start:85526 stop:86677 length:1152 start_codon:yes stop_codon:yes gene_type:complete